MLSEAPVSMSGITGSPGHICAATCSSGPSISGLGRMGGNAVLSGARSETLYAPSTKRTVTSGSAKIAISFWRISSAECPGRIRQFRSKRRLVGCAVGNVVRAIHETDGDFGVREDSDQLLANLLRRVSGQDPAVPI